MSATSPASAIPPGGGPPLPAGDVGAAGPEVAAAASLDVAVAPVTASVSLPAVPAVPPVPAVPSVPPVPSGDVPASARTAGTERVGRLRARIAVGALVGTGSLVAVAAAHTESLLPESIRPIPASLAGAFGSVFLNLHVGGAIAALVLMFMSYAAVVAWSGQLSARTVIIAIVAVHAVVLLGPPLASTDLFSYQAYARMGAVYGINPYTHAPYAINLDSIFPYVGAKWSTTTASAYGPVFTVATYLLAPLTIAGTVIAYKSIAALASLALVAVVWRCARLRGVDPVKAAALVGLNPLLVIYAVGGGHNDLLMLLAMAGGIYAILASREAVGGGLTVLAIGVKLTAGLVLPFALADGGAARHARRSRGRLALGAGVGLAALSFGVFGAGSGDMLGTVTKSQSEGGWQSLPGVLSVKLHQTAISHITGYVLAAVFVVALCWLLRRVWRGELDWIAGAGWAMLVMLVASSSLLPWYVAWLLPLAALGRDRRLATTAIVFTGIIQGITLLGYIPHGFL